jgi:hypothetical protein
MTWEPGETVRKRAANLPCMCCVTGNTHSSFCVRRERVVAEVKDAPAIQAIILRKQFAELDNGHGPGSVIGDDCCRIRRDVKALVRPWSRIVPEFPNLAAAYGLCRGDRSGDIEMEWRIHEERKSGYTYTKAATFRSFPSATGYATMSAPAPICTCSLSVPSTPHLMSKVALLRGLFCSWQCPCPWPQQPCP